jgi:hypothetical protein
MAQKAQMEENRMSKSTMKAVQIILLSSMLFLAGCNAPSAQPTLDPNVIYTAAAQTVQAQLVVASAGTATAAAVQPTQPPAAPVDAPTLLATVPANPSPTFTLGATLSINLTPGVTAVPGGPDAGPTVSVAIATLVPTGTPIAPIPTGDKGAYVDQTVDDGTLVNKNTNFDQIFKIKNTGTTTWDTTNYYYADMTNSDQIAKKTWYFLQAEVKPNTIAQFTVDMKTPGTSGKYTSTWCLLNKANPSRCIVIFDTTINVP